MVRISFNLRFNQSSLVMMRVLAFDMRLEVVSAWPEFGRSIDFGNASGTDITSW